MVRRLLYILIGVVALFLVLVVISLFTFLPMITSAHTSQTTPTVITSATPTPTPIKQNGNVTAKVLKQYAPDIKSQIAQGLKLTPDALTAQLKAGKTLSDVANAQGVSTTQLQTIVANALRTSLKPAVDDGTLTQKQLNNLSKRYEKNPALLDKLLGGKAAKVAPTITPTPAQ